MRIFFAADSHLNKHYARMTPDQLSRRRERLRSAWEETVAAAITAGADLYIHGGDLFDSPNPRAAELTRVVEGFQRLADAGVAAVALGGNHDIPKNRLGYEAPQTLLQSVRLARAFTGCGNLEWWQGEFAGLTVAVGGLAPDPALGPDDDPLAIDVVPPAADLVLLVTHYALEGALGPSPTEATIRKSSVAGLAGRVHALLVGHVHVMHDSVLGGVRVLSPGATERMSFGELSARPGFVEIVATGRPPELTVRIHRLRSQPMRRDDVPASALPQADPTAWLADRVRAQSDPDQILQLRLHGVVPRAVYHALCLPDVIRIGSALNFYFDFDRHGLTVAGGARPTNGMGRVSARAEIDRVAALHLARAQCPHERSLLAEARDLALANVGPGSVADADGDGP